MKINYKLNDLRALMSKNGIHACIIPSSDPHGSEYVAECWKTREWISGFTGSAGTVVVTPDFAGLWTDFRYYIQAESELSDSEITLYRMGEPDVPTHIKWLSDNLPKKCKVGIDGNMFSVTDVEKLEKRLDSQRIEILTDFDFASKLWIERPAIPASEAFSFSSKYTGKLRKEKIQEIRGEMGKKGADYHLLAALDDIAWTFNLRGSDIDYSPVSISFALISMNQVSLFIESDKIPDDLRNELEHDGITLMAYDAIYKFLEEQDPEGSVLLSPDNINTKVFKSIPETCRIIRDKNIPTLLKALKNKTEIAGIRNSLIKDGAAICSFLHWLEENAGKIEITELSAADVMHEFRKMQDLFVDDSFNAIMAYRDHAAMCHYSADETSSSDVNNNGLFLTDSGGHYLDGTTDTTRTVTLGTPTKEEIRDYTLVLKGHIAVARAMFPKGTRGYQIDTLARMAMWEEGINFGHGTGHGIGFFLNVHEGPHSISPHPMDITLKEGMCVTNEPGIYRDGKHGIRIENMIIVEKAMDTEFGEFLKFENVTLCPYDSALIDKEILTENEINWINTYHGRVYEKISVLLDNEVMEWLKEKTQPL